MRWGCAGGGGGGGGSMLSVNFMSHENSIVEAQFNEAVNLHGMLVTERKC